jgi:hypothetical protein
MFQPLAVGVEEFKVFNKKPREVPFSDLIDLLLDSDEETRKLVLFEALQSGTLRKSEAEQVIAQVERLERAAAPRHTPEPVEQSVAVAASVQQSMALVAPLDDGEPVDHVGQAA